MSRRRLLVMVGLLTVVVLTAFALPTIANEDMMASNTPEVEDSNVSQHENNDRAQRPAQNFRKWRKYRL